MDSLPAFPTAIGVPVLSILHATIIRQFCHVGLFHIHAESWPVDQVDKAIVQLKVVLYEFIEASQPLSRDLLNQKIIDHGVRVQQLALPRWDDCE